MEKIFGTEVYPFESEMGISLRLRDRAVMTVTQLKVFLKSSPEVSYATEKRFQRLPHFSNFRIATLCVYDKYFRFCADCLAEGYHSFWHQLLALKLCPIHLATLKFECNCCGAFVGRYDRFGSAMRHAFHCNKCGMEIFGAPMKLREQPTNTEIFGVAFSSFQKIEIWIDSVVSSIDSTDLLINSIPPSDAAFEFNEANIPAWTNLLCINKFNVSHKILAFEPHPIIYLRFNKTIIPRLSDFNSTQHLSNGHLKNYFSCLTMVVKRIESSFKIKHVKSPTNIFASWDLSTSPLILNEAPVAAVSLIIIVFDASTPKQSRYEKSLFEVGNMLKANCPHRTFFAFSVLDLFFRLLTHLSAIDREKPITLYELFLVVSAAPENGFSYHEKFCPSGLLGLPESRGFSRLTEKGIFRRCKVNFLEHATP